MKAASGLLTCLSVLALVAACSAGSSASPGGPATPGATQGGTALVHGTQVCQRTSYDSRTEGANEIAVEHFRCTYQVNDPRIGAGQFEADVTTSFEPADAPSARWEATATITTADGVWTGTYRGAPVVWPNTSGPYSYAEGTYTGSGAYEGLVYHELIAGSNSKLTVSGSIEPAG